MIYSSWNIRCNKQNFLSFWPNFCSFSPLTTMEIKILTLKKTLWDIIILHSCMINDNQMMYGSWDMECSRQNFLSLSTVVCPLTPNPPPSLTTQKINILKKWKKAWRYYHFTHVYQKWQLYDVWFLRYQVQQAEFFVILDYFFPFYPLNNLKNQQFEKMKKTHGDIIILHMCTINDSHMMYGFWDMEHDRHNFYHFGPIFALLTS